MRKLLFHGVLVFSIFFAAFQYSPAAEGGRYCLFCHKYPGLVTYHDEELKVLHVDEERYTRSPHGEVECKECHTAITKVPHTGVTEVDCFTNCHQEDREKIATDPASLKNLHQEEHSYIVSLEEDSSCRVCHPLYPHSENNWVRAFLNMHTGFMRCEVCHVKRESISGLTYHWDESGKAVFSGKPFGSYYAPASQRAQAAEGTLSRIAVFVSDNGAKKPLASATGDVRKAREYMEEEAAMTPEEKEEKLAYFHRQIARKEISVACHGCHSKDTVLNYTQLGFDGKKAQDLMYLNIRGLITKYKTFYFPDLFGH